MRIAVADLCVEPQGHSLAFAKLMVDRLGQAGHQVVKFVTINSFNPEDFAPLPPELVTPVLYPAGQARGLVGLLKRMRNLWLVNRTVDRSADRLLVLSLDPLMPVWLLSPRLRKRLTTTFHQTYRTVTGLRGRLFRLVLRGWARASRGALVLDETVLSSLLLVGGPDLAPRVRVVCGSAQLPDDGLRREPSKSGPTLFFPGIPREEKGIDLFLDALTKLGPLPAARFFLTGSSAITDPETQKLLQEALARLGESLAVSPAIPDMADYQAAVQASDFVVCCHRPAAYAGRASGVLNDAIAAGVPVIAPDYGVFRRVRDWDIGYLYPPEDPGALAGTIVRAVSERRDFTAALAEVRARYSETSQVKQLDDLLAL